MLDSLVRVSRRVGGAADLLTTERRAVPVRHSLYEPAPYLPAAEPGTRGWGTSPQLHPRPRSTTSSSSCEEQEKCSRPQSKAKPGVLADLANPTCPTDSLNLLLRLRAHLRLPLHSFTYSWTLSSKFFSTFPHGTCLLSVSGSYLALRGENGF